MRLFVALLLDESVKDSLCQTILELKKASLCGNFTRRDNLHLTLAFIGETDRAKEVMRAMDAVKAGPAVLDFGGIGCFSRPGGGLYFIGAEKNAALSALYRELYDEITKAGFPLESRAFKPHLTLGREVRFRPGFHIGAFSAALAPVRMTAGKISLMKSERIAGRLTYTEIHAKMLAQRT